MKNRGIGPVVVLLSAACCVAVCRRPQAEDLDLLIKSGRIVNGTGNPWFYGDVGVRGDTIVAIGDLSGRAAATVVDAKGLVVSPGFIDIHTHCDEGLGLAGPNANLNYLTQGTTTVVTGNCGAGTFEIAKTSSAWQKLGIGTNAAMQVGNIPVRRAILGADQLRKPSDEELEQMQDLIWQAMREGAWGISTGLEYEGYDEHVATEEVVALTRPVAELGGIYNSHIRDEAGQLLEAIQETIRIGEQTGVPVNVSHLKSCGKDHWGQMPEAVRLIGKARARGVMITADQYPFLQGAPIEAITELVDVPEDMEPLSSLRKSVWNRETPIEAREDARRRYVTELQSALRNPEARRRLRESTYEKRPDHPGFVARWGWQDFRIKVATRSPELVDRMIIAIIEEQDRDGFDVLAGLIMREPAALFASSSQSADDMRHAMVQEWVMISSDGGALPVIGDGADPAHDHPRPFASQAIVLRKYVREEGLLTLEAAIRKMTSLPAQVMKLKDRGLLLEGYRADIAVFDAETVRDNATYDNAQEYATGVEYVVVNGKVSIDGGRFTGDLNGRVLLKGGTGRASDPRGLS